MNLAIDDFRVTVLQVDLAGPDAPMKVSEVGHGLTPIYRPARRTKREEDHSVEGVGDLLHQEESCPLVLIRRFSIIFLKISTFFGVISDDQIRGHRQVSILIVQESRFPVHEPYAVSVEEDIVRLEKAVVTRHHV